jgi:hypothetical protein
VPPCAREPWHDSDVRVRGRRDGVPRRMYPPRDSRHKGSSRLGRHVPRRWTGGRAGPGHRQAALDPCCRARVEGRPGSRHVMQQQRLRHGMRAVRRPYLRGRYRYIYSQTAVRLLRRHVACLVSARAHSKKTIARLFILRKMAR